MFDNTSTPAGSDHDGQPESPEMTMLLSTVALTNLTHAMADYVLSEETVFRGFCAMLDITAEDTDDEDTVSVADMRLAMSAAHDKLALAQGRAMERLMYAQLGSVFGITPGDAKDDEDNGEITIRPDGFPYI